ncbi:MAG: DNA (cytosine-5-)-methyltransferase [Chitinophagaceae bacterium]|nr:DNA (cytosine-5-)-methyltransferase [Chitinophagaceae bacterium]
MRHGSLFSGIGGFDLAAWWMGWENIFNVETDPFCRQVLKTHFPFAEQFNDIKKFKGKKYYGTVDLISGGFPCQPFSIAGQRRGSEDDRFLWPEMLRIIDEIRPAWVVGENVAGILSMVQPGVSLEVAMQTGLTKENQEIITEHEYVVETICKDIERIGYSIEPFVIPACSTGAPHRRNRVWFIGHTGRTIQGEKISTRKEKNYKHRAKIPTRSAATDQHRIIADPDRKRLEGSSGEILQTGTDRQPPWLSPIPDWCNWPSQSPVCRRDDGISRSLVNVSFSKWRKESIRAFGNAIVPQAAYQLFSAIELVHQQKQDYESIS